MKCFYARILLSTTILSSAVLALPAFAQNAPAAPPVSNSDATTIEVVITAQRRSESLQKTPIAVTALSPAILEQRSVRTSQELMQVVPSLQVSTQTAGNGGGSATFFLRGMGQQRAGNGSQPAVGIYVDDFYYPSVQGTLFSIMDIQQVEVLRGPQGTLFGRNTIGGAIRYATKRPESVFGGFLTATAGSFDRWDVNAALNIPLGDKAAIRFTGGNLDSGGYVRSAATGKMVGGETTTLGRLQLRIKPTDTVTIDLAAQDSGSSSNGFAYTLPGPFDQGQVTGIWNHIPPGIANPYDDRYKSECTYCQPGTNEYANGKSDSINGVAAWELSPNITLKSLTGYTRVASHSFTDLDGTLLPVIEFAAYNMIGAFSQEFQMNGKSDNGTLKWTSGLYYFESHSVDTSAGTVVGAPTVPYEIDRGTISRAAYLDLTWQATDKLAVLGGYRTSADNSHAATGNQYARETFASGTGRLGVQYQWTDNVMSYGTIAQGFRGGGFNRLDNGTLQSFRPENSLSYEVGGRFSLFNHKLVVNPTVFYTDWEDIQVQRIEYTSATTFNTLFENAAKAHTYGLELEANAAISKNFHLFGHLATLEARYDSTGGATGITDDSLFQRAPKLSYGLGGSYRFDLHAAGDVTAIVNYSWTDTQASTPTDSDHLILPSYGLTNLRFEYKTPNSRWTVSAFVTNLFDQVYYVGGVDYAESSPHYDLGRPQEFGLSARVNF